MPTPQNLNGLNVLIFLTDQERAIQHFPPDWAEKNLPGQDALRQWIRIAKQGHPNGRCGCLRRDAALFEFSGEVCCGETVLCVSAGD